MAEISRPLHTDITIWKEKKLFDDLPVPAALLDDQENVIYANKQLAEVFGTWEGKKCSEVYQKKSACDDGSCSLAFVAKEPHVSKGEGITKSGQAIHYTKYSMPLLSTKGEAPYVLEMCIDNTSADIMRREYQSLFDLVPCNIVIIDKELRIIDSNQNTRDLYGDLEGRQCFAALKGQESHCADCIAKNAFVTRKTQHDHQIWVKPDGTKVHYQVTAVPIVDNNGKVSAIMEMAVDITELLYLREQDELKTMTLASVVENSQRGIIVITDNGEIPIINNALLKLFGFPSIGLSDPQELFSLLPDNVNRAISSGVDRFRFNEVLLFPERGDDAIPVSIYATRMKHGTKGLGLYLTFHDLTQEKAQEQARMETERLVAVGQTVSGLAHGIKNLVTALEGGMYMLNSGMQGGKADRIAQGMEMLDRNIQRIGGFVKNFLHFARGREIKPQLTDPSAVALEVADQYRASAQQNNIIIEVDVETGVEDASIDAETMNEALSNFVTNAIDACRITEEGKKCAICISFREENGELIYEVQDTGSGMDDATRKKVFTSFFTTKGDHGTGIGLLMTKKLVQAHGGYIEVESTLGEGSTFRMRMPRSRLPNPYQPREVKDDN